MLMGALESSLIIRSERIEGHPSDLRFRFTFTSSAKRSETGVPPTMVGVAGTYTGFCISVIDGGIFG
jgi:hypothetical protein